MSRVKSARNRLSLSLLTTAKYLTLAAVRVRVQPPAPRTEAEIMARATEIAMRRMQEAEQQQAESSRTLVSLLTAIRGAHTIEEPESAVALHEEAERLIAEVNSPSKAHEIIDMLAHYAAYLMSDDDLATLAQSLVEDLLD